jgi:hypothetical protein
MNDSLKPAGQTGYDIVERYTQYVRLRRSPAKVAVTVRDPYWQQVLGCLISGYRRAARRKTTVYID